MKLALVFIISGLIICFGAFIFAAINMIHGIYKGKRSFSESNFDSIFKKHIGAIIVMAFGSFLFILGLIIAGVNIIQ